MKVLNRKTAPQTASVDSLTLPQPEVIKLPNGLEVYLLRDSSVNIVKLELAFEAGSWYQHRCLLASATNAMLREGSRNFTSAQIAEKIDFYGSYLNLDADQDYAYASIYALEKYFEPTFEVLEDIVKYPLFPQSELELYLSNQKNKFRIEMEKVRFVARQKFASVLYGEHHPYGMNASLTDYDTLGREEIEKFFSENYRLENCKIFLSGKINDSIIKKIESSFGREPIQERNTIQKEFAIQPYPDKRAVFQKERAMQSAVRVGKILFNRSHPDFIAMNILNTALGGYFGSRLMKNIREDKGYTYGISSFILPFRHSGYFCIAGEVKAEHTQDTLDEIYKEIKRIREKEIPTDELETVKSYMSGQILRSLDGIISVSERLRTLMLSGMDLNYYQTFLQTLKKISSEQLLSIAQRYLDENTLKEVIAGRI